MKIYYEDNHIIVIEKPINQPTQQDSSNDFDTLSMVKDYIKVTYNKPGNVFVGLVHRLDRPVGGVMVFAKTSKAASRLSDQIRTRSLDKEYTAVVVGKTQTGSLTNWLIKDTKTNTSSVTKPNSKNAKEARLTILTSSYNATNNLSKVTVHLETGRHHQIRVQLSHNGTPIWGDARYNSTSKPGQQIALWASKLEFDHPTTKKRLTFESQTPSEFPYLLW